MAIYGTYTQNGSIIRASDGACIPAHGGNRDYQEAMAALEAGDTITPYAPPPPSAVDLYAEKDRRLALGFYYNFGDQRGVHHIGTTKNDLEGWDDVTKWADTKLKLDQPNANTTIVTDTGPAMIKPMEWYRILDRASDVRQVIWGSLFALLAGEIPTDYTEDYHWGGPDIYAVEGT